LNNIWQAGGRFGKITAPQSHCVNAQLQNCPLIGNIAQSKKLTHLARFKLIGLIGLGCWLRLGGTPPFSYPLSIAFSNRIWDDVVHDQDVTPSKAAAVNVAVAIRRCSPL